MSAFIITFLHSVNTFIITFLHCNIQDPEVAERVLKRPGAKEVMKKPAGKVIEGSLVLKKPAGKKVKGGGGGDGDGGDDLDQDEDGYVVEKLINRNKMHQFQKNFATFPQSLKDTYNEVKNDRKKKTLVVNSTIQALN